MSAVAVSALSEVVAASDPLLAEYAMEPPPAGPYEERFDSADRRFVFEALSEGYRMHYGEPIAFSGMDPDLRLLAGDALYALALSRLAARRDIDAVAELADLISLCARAEAENRPDVVAGLWEASARRLSPEGGRGAREVAREAFGAAG